MCFRNIRILGVLEIPKGLTGGNADLSNCHDCNYVTKDLFSLYILFFQRRARDDSPVPLKLHVKHVKMCPSLMIRQEEDSLENTTCFISRKQNVKT